MITGNIGEPFSISRLFTSQLNQNVSVKYERVIKYLTLSSILRVRDFRVYSQKLTLSILENTHGHFHYNFG